MLDRDKHSSLLRKFVAYDRKKFYDIGSRVQCYKTFLSVIYGFSYKARVFVRIDWKSLHMTNTLA